ncbi:MAG: ABC transporter permease [Spirochaetia bacterium]
MRIKNTPAIQNVKEVEAREWISQKSESLRSIYWRRFKKHTLGKIGAVILLFLYFCAFFADFLSPYTMTWTDKKKSYHPPTGIYWSYKDNGEKIFRPFSYEMMLTSAAFKTYSIIPPYSLRAISREPIPGVKELRSIATDKTAYARKQKILSDVAGHYNLSRSHEAIQRLSKAIDEMESNKMDEVRIVFRVGTRKIVDDEEPLELILAKGNKNFLSFFYKGVSYRFLGLFTTRVHLFGSPTGGYYPLGADQLGRDVLSRLLHGSRVSLSVGILGALISFTLGLIIGGLAGYFGGIVDNILMRLSEIVIAFPAIYLLFTLRATFPTSLTSIQVYLLIVMILSAIGWAGLARIIRGLVLSIKNEDYVLSARTMGLSNWKLVRKHILPNTLSFVIIQVTISIPSYILGESSLSLLGLGINEPQASWGLMLADARNTRVMMQYPWILIPGFAIFVAIMAWNFFGDGIRDAVDPRSKH